MSYIEYKVKVYSNGDKFWYLNNKLHREDGPAAELANGSSSYYLEGKSLIKYNWEKTLAPAKELTVAQISELLGYEVKIVKCRR